MSEVDKIINARSVIELFKELNEWKKEYSRLAKLVHPDVNKHPRAIEAMQKLTLFKSELEKGKEYRDDVGTVNVKPGLVAITGEEKAIIWSFSNYQYLTTLENEEPIKKYLPMVGNISGIPNVSTGKLENTTIYYQLANRGIPLNQVGVLPVVHVNWVISRMLEFSALLSNIGMIHGGLTPDSILLEPETHGICIISFYHLTHLNNQVKTVSGGYQHFYPNALFKNKIATDEVDLECIRRIGIYLLGDKSGIGNGLKGKTNEKVLQFLQTNHVNSLVTWNKWKKLLNDNFKKEFHPLNM